MSDTPLNANMEQPLAQRSSVLEVLESSTSRRVLMTLGTEALTAKEVSNETDISLSTVYRVLADLEQAGLVRESVRFNRDGRHVAEYTRTVSEVTLRFDEDLSLEVTSE